MVGIGLAHSAGGVDLEAGVLVWRRLTLPPLWPAGHCSAYREQRLAVLLARLTGRGA
jgi:hypothetical protein